MRYIKVAAVGLNQTPLDWENNQKNIINAIKKAREMGVNLLCFPELCISGYGCEDMFLSASTQEMALKMAFAIAKETEGMIVAIGLPLSYRGALYNTASVIVDGKISGFVAKQHLANTGVYYESRWFKPWPKGECVSIMLDNQTFPLGDLLFDINNVRIGFEICEDAWVAVRTGIGLAERGLDILLNPSASHFAFGKSKIRKRFVQEGAQAFGVCYVYANLMGNDAGRLIYDGDTIICSGAEILADGPRFSFQDYIITTASIDIEALRLERSKTADLSNGFGIVRVISESLSQIVAKNTNVSLALSQNTVPIWEKSKTLKEEEFTRAVALGLFDYLRKSRAHGFVLNLSGGADSSSCAILVYLMIKMALAELGENGIKKKLPYLLNDNIEHLLFCIYQQTENNSIDTKNAAEALAKALGFPLAELNIDELVQSYQALVEPAVGRPLSWENDNISLQNVQARVRGPSAWLLANVRHAILLSTSNRSEGSVGYTTLDGDTCGGLSPLAGIDKSFILQWLKWLEKEGPVGVGPFPVLKEITRLEPSAELCPRAFSQTDETDLMPYHYLDTIERLFVLNKKSPIEILNSLHILYPSESHTVLGNYIDRFFHLWAQNQWKRERLAPAFHLDDESIDPKTWCRFPILSGGFKSELEEMWEIINKSS